MIVIEKGQYFSAMTKQQYLQFDTEELKTEVIQMVKRNDDVDSVAGGSS